MGIGFGIGTAAPGFLTARCVWELHEVYRINLPDLDPEMLVYSAYDDGPQMSAKVTPHHECACILVLQRMTS